MSDDDPTEYEVDLHMYGQAITWIVLVDINIILGILKYNRIASLLHMINGLCILFITYFFILWFLLPYGFIEEQKEQLIYYLHGIFGCAMLGFMVLIVGSGLFSKFYRDARFSTSLKYIVVNFHKIFAYTIIVVFKANCLWNWYQTDTTPFTWFMSWQSLTFLIWVYLKFFSYRMQREIVDVRTENPFIGEVQSIKEIKQLKIPYVIYNHHIYDASEVINHHPGGSKVIQTILGREVDRFLYGMYSSELCPQVLPHSHSTDALKLLKEPILRIVGPRTYNNFNNKLGAKIQFIATVSKATQIYVLGLQKQEYQYNFLGYQHISQLGQFYSLSMKNQTTRLYTAVNFLTQKNINLINQMIPHLKYSLETEMHFKADTNKSQSMITEVGSIRENLIGSSRQRPKYLPLMMKIYPNGKFTSAFFRADFETEIFQLSQPKGLGLELEITEPGKIVIVAGGTGLFPFSDLIDLLFKATFIEKNQRLNEQILKKNPILQRKPFEQFSFLLLAAINEPEDLHPITREQIFYLSEHSGNFKAVLRVSNNQGGLGSSKKIELTRDYFKTRALRQCSGSDFSRVWICGPPKMASQTAAELLQNGIPRTQILLL